MNLPHRPLGPLQFANRTPNIGVAPHFLKDGCAMRHSARTQYHAAAFQVVGYCANFFRPLLLHRLPQHAQRSPAVGQVVTVKFSQSRWVASHGLLQLVEDFRCERGLVYRHWGLPT